MEEIYEEYEKNGSIKSSVSIYIWKFGVIIMTSIYSIVAMFFNQYWYLYLLFYLVIMIVLFGVCKMIFYISVSKKLKLDRHFNLSFIKEIYSKIKEYQQKWIEKYCNDVGINDIEKLKILRQEIKERDEKSTVKYFNPIIIGSLALTLWEIGIQKMVDMVGFLNVLSIAIILAIGISVGVGWLMKIVLEDIKVFLEFDKFSSKENLEELLLYRILKA